MLPKNPFKNETGYATVLALIVMVVLAILLVGLAPLVVNSIHGSVTNQDAVEAQYAAEAGAKRTIEEFYKVNQSLTPDWTWLNKDQAFLNDVNNQKYRVIIYTATDATKTPVTPVFTVNTTYTIQSTGTVENAQKIVTVNIDVIGSGSGGGSNDVFGKYPLFSSLNLQIDNTPKITGDIGSNGHITVNSSTPLINGKAYTPYVPVMDQWTWNKSAVTGGYVYANPAGTLDASSLIPTFPTKSASGTSLSTSTTSLAAGEYYYNGNYQTGNTLTASGNVTIYINGNLTLGQVGSTSGAIKGGNVTIYVTGSVLLSNTASIQVSSLKLYASGGMQMTNTTAINATNVLIQTKGDINFNSDSSINKNSTSAVTKIYSNGSVQFTNQFELDDSAGLVVTTGTMNINSNVIAKQTVFVAGSDSQVTNYVQIGGVYSNGTLSINSSPQINYSNQLSTIVETLGLNGTASVSISQGSWSGH